MLAISVGEAACWPGGPGTLIPRAVPTGSVTVLLPLDGAAVVVFVGVFVGVVVVAAFVVVVAAFVVVVAAFVVVVAVVFAVLW